MSARLAMHALERIKTAYNEVEVWETPDGFDFEVAGGTHATWSRERILTGYIWDAMSAATLLHKAGPPRKILVLGFGGGTVVHQLRHLLPAAQITALEIDAVMLDLAKRFMQADERKAQLILGDGYAFARETRQRFDVVIDDIFTGLSTGVSRPWTHTPKHLQAVCQCLKPSGLFIVNLITGRQQQPTVQRTKAALRQRFDVTRQIRPAKGFNVCLMGGPSLPANALATHASKFPHPLDQRDWADIRVRCL